MFCKYLYFAWELLFKNNIGNIGTKYLGLGLSKLNKLTYLELNLDFVFIIKLQIVELNN